MTTFRFSRRCLIPLIVCFPLSWSTVGATQQRGYTVNGTEIQVEVHVQQDAGEIADKCKFDASAPPPEAFLCAGYLTAVSDAMEVVWAAHGLPRAFCMPDGVERRALVESFTKFMRAHPEKRGLPAALAALQAYRKTFPCSAKSRQ